MFHTLGFFEAIDSTANTDIQPVVDDFFRIQNNHFLSKETWDLVAAYVGSLTLSRARISTPTLDKITSPFIVPATLSLLPPADPNVADYRERPLKLTENEEIILEATSGIAMGTENFHGLFFVTRGMRPMPSGDVYTIRGTGTTTVTANVWSTVTVTWANNLPNGVYAVVGLLAQGATAVGARMIFQDQLPRPGAVAEQAVTSRTHKMFRMGGLGEWGRFDNYEFPIIQYLCNAADTAQEMYMDVVRVG